MLFHYHLSLRCLRNCQYRQNKLSNIIFPLLSSLISFCSTSTWSLDAVTNPWRLKQFHLRPGPVLCYTIKHFPRSTSTFSDFIKSANRVWKNTEMDAFSISLSLFQFHFRSTCIIKSCISVKVPALCRMNKLWWQIGCEWELGQNDSVQYDSALSHISPFPYHHHHHHR